MTIVAARAARTEFPIALAIALARLPELLLMHAGRAQLPTVRPAAGIDVYAARPEFKGLSKRGKGSNQEADQD